MTYRMMLGVRSLWNSLLGLFEFTIERREDADLDELQLARHQAA